MKKVMKITLGLAVLSGAAALAYSVSKRMVRGSGNIIKEVRTVNPFRRVVASTGKGVVQVRQADETSVEIEADDNLLERVETVVQDDTLKVSVKSGKDILLPSQPIRVRVMTPTIEELKIEGQGNIETGDIKTDHLNLENNGVGTFSAGITTVEHLVVNMNGVGKVNGGPVDAKQFILNANGIGKYAMTGTVDKLVLNANGVSRFEGSELHCRVVEVIANGITNAIVWAENELRVEASGPSKVMYRGEPKLEKILNGPARVRKLEEPPAELKSASEASQV